MNVFGDTYKMINNHTTREQDNIHTHEEEEAYDMGWAYAEDHPQIEDVCYNPYSEDIEPLLYDAWRDGFCECIHEIET